MPKINKKLGVGAQVSILVRFPHPKMKVQEMLGPMKSTTERLDKLLAYGSATKKIGGKDVFAVLLRHEKFKNVEVYATASAVQVEVAGSEESFFKVQEKETNLPIKAPEADTEKEKTRTKVVIWANKMVTSNKARILENQDIQVHNDNAPLEKNIPAASKELMEVDEMRGVEWAYAWGFHGIDLHHKNGQKQNKKAHYPHVEYKPYLNIFWNFFLKMYAVDVLLKETNKELDKAVTLGEFTQFVGIIFLLSTVKGCQCQEFWSNTEIDAFKSPPYWFNRWMTGARFNEILAVLHFTNVPYPKFTNKFHKVCQLMDAWNNNMSEKFVPS